MLDLHNSAHSNFGSELAVNVVNGILNTLYLDLPQLDHLLQSAKRCQKQAPGPVSLQRTASALRDASMADVGCSVPKVGIYQLPVPFRSVQLPVLSLSLVPSQRATGSLDGEIRRLCWCTPSLLPFQSALGSELLLPPLLYIRQAPMVTGLGAHFGSRSILTRHFSPLLLLLPFLLHLLTKFNSF
jgi:hypothetical protein